MTHREPAMPIDRSPEDIPEVVAEEIAAAHQAGIPPPDQPAYVADRIRLRIAGSVEYTRKRPLSPARRAELIVARFDGTNARALALEFDVSIRRVRQILNDARAARGFTPEQ